MPGVRDRTSITKTYGERKPLLDYDPECDLLEHFDELAHIVEVGTVVRRDDDDPFTDLGETLADDAADRDSAELGGEADECDPTTDAAFSYDDADQRPFYACTETIDEFNSWLNYELERDLHDCGYQNIVVREMTDAFLRTVVEEDLLDAVTERFEHARENASGKSD